jgi:hypothetical protein
MAEGTWRLGQLAEAYWLLLETKVLKAVANSQTLVRPTET